MTTKYSRLPPSGSKKPPTSNSSQLSHETIGKQLGNAQLLFEPSPPKLEKTLKNRSPSPSIRRRTQSAKTSQNKSSKALFASASSSAERRPVSAVVPGEKKYYPTRGNDGHHNASRKTIHVPVPKQFLEFEDSNPCPHHPSMTDSLQRHEQRNHQGELDFRGSGSHDIAGHPGNLVEKNFRRSRTSPDEYSRSDDTSDALPRGIAALAPWVTPELPTEWIGVDADKCMVFLPSLLSESEALPIVPPPQGPADVLPHKPPPPQPKPFDPRKLFHYDVEKNLPSHMKDQNIPRPKSRPGTSRHGRIYSLNGQILHDQSKYSWNRTAQMVRQEIEDLEMLLEGVGRKGSANPVVQYQYEISMLKKAVSDTIIQCHLLRRPKPKEEEPPDLTGLREYIREREQVLAKIKARREACLAELAKLDKSFVPVDHKSQNAD